MGKAFRILTVVMVIVGAAWGGYWFGQTTQAQADAQEITELQNTAFGFREVAQQWEAKYMDAVNQARRFTERYNHGAR